MGSRKKDPFREKIRKMVHEWERTGKITTSRAVYRPKSKKQVIKQALAIEYGRMRQEGKK